MNQNNNFQSSKEITSEMEKKLNRFNLITNGDKISQSKEEKSIRPGTPPPHIFLPRSAPMLIRSEKMYSKERSFSLSAPKKEPSFNNSSSLIELAHSFEGKTQLNGLSISPSELIGPFVGSFQESILSGHMSHTPSTIFEGFQAELGACGKNFLAKHVRIPFNAIYYHIDYDVPYVGTIKIDRKGYKVPPKGMIQITISNPSNTPIKTFLVKYDLSDMPPQTKTFLRQKIVTSNPPVLRYAVHLKFVSPKKRKYYLYKNIRIVFAHRMPDDMDSLQVSYDAPNNPRYFSYSLPQQQLQTPENNQKDEEHSE